MTELHELTVSAEDHSASLVRNLNYTVAQREGGFDDSRAKEMALFYLAILRSVLSRIERELGGHDAE